MLVGVHLGRMGAGSRKKLFSQLARLLRPYNIFPVDVGPAHARRKGYKRAQFEHLFRSLPRPSSTAQPVLEAMEADLP